MNSSFYLALALLVAVVIADNTRDKKEVIYNPYGQITDANKFLATAGYNNYNNYQQLPYNNNNYYQPAAYSAYNHQYYQQQQPYQRVGGYPYNGDIATGYNYQQHHNQYNYPYNSGYQQYSGFQQYPYNINQQYPYNINQQYSAYQQQYPYGYQNAYGHQQYPFGYNNAYNFNQVLRQAPAYPSTGAQPISPPVPHPFYHVQGTYYPTTTEVNKPPVTVAPVDPKKTY
ncbi:hypothetical protein ACI65C_008471 [Semiaphis heraclei]